MTDADNTGSYVGMLSQDGAWRWDGQEWVPAAQQPTQPAQKDSTGQTFWGVLLALIAFAIIAFIVYSVYAQQRDEARIGEENDRIACERWHVCD